MPSGEFDRKVSLNDGLASYTARVEQSNPLERNWLTEESYCCTRRTETRGYA
jgi:hypothetical protein